jgi:hypothetical protein
MNVDEANAIFAIFGRAPLTDEEIRRAVSVSGASEEEIVTAR